MYKRQLLHGVLADGPMPHVSATHASSTDETHLTVPLRAQGGLSSALARLMVVVEQYPDLKANQNFLDLQHQLEGTENRINVARQRYNQAVEEFNAAIRKFPENLTNKFLLHLDRKEYFKAEAQAKEAPKVQF